MKTKRSEISNMLYSVVFTRRRKKARQVMSTKGERGISRRKKKIYKKYEISNSFLFC